MDKIAGKINQTRVNWWNAFKSGIMIKGYEYYKPPPELKYRYPAPGSAPHDEVDHPNLYKKHWKTPYRESPYNIQKKEKIILDEENVEIATSNIPHLDPADAYDRLIMREQLPDMTGKDLFFKEIEEKSIEEQRETLMASFESMPKLIYADSRDYAPWQHDLDQDYFPRQALWRERNATGWDNEPIYKEIFVELEYLIEEVVGQKRIAEKKMDMLKGTPKKWQILDDHTFDREEIEKIQAAVRAPLPDELDLWKEKHAKPMTLPINNTNVSAWRDDSRAIDTADFDPKFIEYDRERKKRFFLDRYEKPKELAE